MTNPTPNSADDVRSPSQIVGHAWKRSSLWPQDEPDADRAAITWAKCVFKHQEPNLTAAGIPTKSEVFTICGDEALAVRDAMQVMQAALSSRQPDLVEPSADVVEAANQCLSDVLSGYGEYDAALCCNGNQCGCMGGTVHQAIQHYFSENIEAALSASPAPSQSGLVEQYRDPTATVGHAAQTDPDIDCDEDGAPAVNVAQALSDAAENKTQF